MTGKDLNMFVRDLAKDTKAFVSAYVEKALGGLTGRFQVLEEKVRELEKRPVAGATGVAYGGTFDSTKTYPAGTLTTRSGALWVSVRDTAAGELPGASAGWRLVVKKGDA